MKAKSLRLRITAWHVVSLATALIVFGGAVYLGLQGYLVNSLQQSLRSEANGIAVNLVSQAHEKGDVWLSSEVMESYAPESSGRFIRISKEDGEVLYQSGDTRDPFINSAIISHATADPRPGFRQESSERGNNLLVYSLPYVAPSGGHYVVETGASPSPIQGVLRSLLITLLVLTPLILLAAGVGGFLLMSRRLRPIVSLTEQAESVGTRDLGERLTVIETGDELERLSLSLNRMIGRMEAALAHNHRFSADASHELRTPLTILRGELEFVAQTTDLQPAVGEAVGSALEEIDRMSNIVESLLAISRLDSGGERMQRMPVDLRALAAWTVDQMRLLAEEKDITLTCAGGDPILVLGDEARLKQVLVNLLDNAIKYTGLHGSVSVAVYALGRLAVLEVEDNGMGIPSTSLDHVFDRFYRADKARSRESGGTGLGLSIVKAICSAHEGIVSIESAEGCGTTARVELALYGTAGSNGNDATLSGIGNLLGRAGSPHDEEVGVTSRASGSR